MRCGHFVLNLFSPCVEVLRGGQLNAFDRPTVTQTVLSMLSRCNADDQGHVLEQDTVSSLLGHKCSAGMC